MRNTPSLGQAILALTIVLALLISPYAAAEPPPFPDPYQLILQSPNGMSLDEVRRTQAEYFNQVTEGEDKRLSFDSSTRL